VEIIEGYADTDMKSLYVRVNIRKVGGSTRNKLGEPVEPQFIYLLALQYNIAIVTNNVESELGRVVSNDP
jgi:hypothetical protein